jgi:hypothetical protein
MTLPADTINLELQTRLYLVLRRAFRWHYLRLPTYTVPTFLTLLERPQGCLGRHSGQPAQALWREWTYAGHHRRQPEQAQQVPRPAAS